MGTGGAFLFVFLAFVLYLALTGRLGAYLDLAGASA